MCRRLTKQWLGCSRIRTGRRAWWSRTSWNDPTTGDEIDLGPHILVSEYRNMLAFIDKLGITDAVVWHDERLIRRIEPTRSEHRHRIADG